MEVVVVGRLGWHCFVGSIHDHDVLHGHGPLDHAVYGEPLPESRHGNQPILSRHPRGYYCYRPFAVE